MKVYKGIIKKIPTQSQFEQYHNDEIKLKELNITDTVQKLITKEGIEIEYLNFKLSYKEVDKNGLEKYIYNQETKEYEKIYNSTSVISATGKEMRIILELGEFAPIKIIVNEKEYEGTSKIYYNALCVQNQKSGCQ